MKNRFILPWSPLCIQWNLTIHIEVFRLALVYKKVCVVQTPAVPLPNNRLFVSRLEHFRPTDRIVLRQHFYKTLVNTTYSPISDKTYQNFSLIGVLIA